MRIIPHQNAASTVIAATGTSTAVLTLIDTAGTLTNSASYFLSPNNGGPADGLMITPRNGSVRIGFGITPTSALGQELLEGMTYYFPNTDLLRTYLIRTGSINVRCDVEIVRSGNHDLPSAYNSRGRQNVLNAVISAANSGDNTIVAAPGAGLRIRVLSYFYKVTSAVNVRFESGAGGTALTGIVPYGAEGGVAKDSDSDGLFECAVNTLLNMELSGAVQVSGHLNYVII